MTDQRLRELAERAGVAPSWRDVHGQTHEVAPPTLRAVLHALGLPAETDADIDASLSRLGGDLPELPPLVTAELGQPIQLRARPGRFQLVLEDGTTLDGTAEPSDGGAVLPAVHLSGYHQLQIGDQLTLLAVAPRRCFGVAEAAPGRRPWGLAVQLYGLRRPGGGGLGDFGTLRDFAQAAGRTGAAAVAISPVHAQFSADPERFSPYSPSSRLLLNVLHAEIDLRGAEADELEGRDLVDWPAAARLRLATMRRMFDAADSAVLAELDEFRLTRGDALETHARFEALHASLFGANPAQWHWRTWPEQYRDPRSPAVAEFARAHERDVAFHAFMQFLADGSLGAAQRAARDAGMPIGLIADLAVGADSGGSHCWSRQAETLLGLTVGAPPDLLSPGGQSWGLAAFSPRGLVQNGFAAYLEMLRAAMRHAGGVRIDHVMGLARLWVVPDGASAKEGAYLSFSLQDLLRLIALESTRHRAVVLGEDLGTVPEGFQDRLHDAGILGMRVLWFEQQDGRYTSPRTWTPSAAAMTSTHDLTTVAGWWAGRDIEWRKRVGASDSDTESSQHARENDRAALWAAFRDSGATQDDAPSREQTTPVADAALRHLGTAACDLVIIPIEDALALVEQPNLPGTMDEHPNWRRRLPGPAGMLLDDPAAVRRLSALNDKRAHG